MKHAWGEARPGRANKLVRHSTWRTLAILTMLHATEPSTQEKEYMRTVSAGTPNKVGQMLVEDSVADDYSYAGTHQRKALHHAA